jgi:hypothetical protein
VDSTRDLHLDRCAAYVAARAALVAIANVSERWPLDLAQQAKQHAMNTVMTTAEGLSFEHGSPGRRRCVRNALGTALSLAATIDVVRAIHADETFAPDTSRAQDTAGKAVALLGLLFQANSMTLD